MVDKKTSKLLINNANQTIYKSSLLKVVGVLILGWNLERSKPNVFVFRASAAASRCGLGLVPARDRCEAALWVLHLVT